MDFLHPALAVTILDAAVDVTVIVAVDVAAVVEEKEVPFAIALVGELELSELLLPSWEPIDHILA